MNERHSFMNLFIYWQYYYNNTYMQYVVSQGLLVVSMYYYFGLKMTCFLEQPKKIRQGR